MKNDSEDDLERTLEEHQYNIVKVEDIEDVLQHNIDLILYELEEWNLSKVVEFQQKNKDDIPIVIMARFYTRDVIREGYQLGIKDFLHSPCMEEEILYKIQNILQQEFIKKELQFNINLIHEYKIAIDRSTIVSKTDRKGIITYVNQAFSTISGYTQEELIGKPHSKVRHPDMPKETFKELWKTISSKKSWRGVLKNRKKDGGYYWVNTVINPIVDSEGNIIEYISIRSDVTELQTLQDTLKNKLNITTSNYNEVYQLVKEYEKAIDESNILSRATPNGKITYVNKEFENVSGYKSEELIGEDHRVVRHPDTPDEVLKDLWKTIASGKVWKGLIKNRAKNGEPYWVNSVILPIKNTEGKIIEYISIRNNVTEIIHLHQEIEDTQKELIYRMGEIAESRSKETGNHIKRVAAYSKVLGVGYGLSEEECDLIHYASPMHDIGKVSTPDSILKKPAKLNEEEWLIMKEHAQTGYELLNSEKPILKAAAIIAQQHHEKWDGSGYPQGLSGEDIHIFGRITAIADVFDALGSKRYYKDAWDDEEVFNYLRETSGTHFDPKLIDVFFENLEEMLVIRELYKDS